MANKIKLEHKKSNPFKTRILQVKIIKNLEFDIFFNFKMLKNDT